MNRPLIVAAAVRLLLPRFSGAAAVGPYDGEWTGIAMSTGQRCKRAIVKDDIRDARALFQQFSDFFKQSFFCKESVPRSHDKRLSEASFERQIDPPRRNISENSNNATRYQLPKRLERHN